MLELEGNRECNLRKGWVYSVHHTPQNILKPIQTHAIIYSKFIELSKWFERFDIFLIS